MRLLAFGPGGGPRRRSARRGSARPPARPRLGAIWTTEVNAASATFHGEVNPEGSATTYRFEYVTDAAYQATLPKKASPAPPRRRPARPGQRRLGLSSTLTVSQHVSALRANTTYHYRLTRHQRLGGTTLEPARTFTTQEFGGAFTLPDNRGWELVSPPEKNGGAIQGPEGIHGGGVLQAAATGEGAITYSSASSFGGYEAQGAPPGLPVHLPPHRSRAGRPRTSPPRPSRAPTATNPTASPTSSSRPTSPAR